MSAVHHAPLKGLLDLMGRHFRRWPILIVLSWLSEFERELTRPRNGEGRRRAKAHARNNAATTQRDV
jgi:DNA invertase Pin-like site-specific DNA recombinase